MVVEEGTRLLAVGLLHGSALCAQAASRLTDGPDPDLMAEPLGDDPDWTRPGDLHPDDVLTDEARAMIAPRPPRVPAPKPEPPLAGSVEERIARISGTL